MIQPVYSAYDSSALFYATCRIVAYQSDGAQYNGTGFFFVYPTEAGKGIQVLVTNKHVVANAVSYDLYLHDAAGEPGQDLYPSGKIHGFHVTMLNQGWFDHPSADVDLCATPIEPLRQEAERLGKKIFFTTLSTAHVPNEQVLSQLLALEPVTMIGYPIGLWDEVNNLPIARRGMTASHPRVDFNQKPIAVVDIAVFPGSSGSPVLIVDEGVYASPGGFTTGRRLFLLGILYAGPQFSADGSLEIRQIPTTWTARVSVDVFVHLGYYIKSRELFELGKVLFAADAGAQKSED